MTTIAARGSCIDKYPQLTKGDMATFNTDGCA
jgi:hypothetical protein